MIHPSTDWRWASLLLAVALLALGCGSGGSEFVPCVAPPDCAGDESCFTLESGAGVCLEACAAGQAICEGGEACAEPSLGGETWACLPGGTLGVGVACTRSLDCEIGAVCVQEATSFVCRRRCDPSASACAAGHVCIASGATYGHCAPGSADMGVPTPDAGTDLGPADGG